MSVSLTVARGTLPLFVITYVQVTGPPVPIMIEGLTEVARPIWGLEKLRTFVVSVPVTFTPPQNPLTVALAVATPGRDTLQAYVHVSERSSFESPFASPPVKTIAAQVSSLSVTVDSGTVPAFVTVYANVAVELPAGRVTGAGSDAYAYPVESLSAVARLCVVLEISAPSLARCSD